jgi:hypothetical protein
MFYGIDVLDGMRTVLPIEFKRCEKSGRVMTFVSSSSSTGLL